LATTVGAEKHWSSLVSPSFKVWASSDTTDLSNEGMERNMGTHKSKATQQGAIVSTQITSKLFEDCALFHVVGVGVGAL
jgi:hypothetical protein